MYSIPKKSRKVILSCSIFPDFPLAPTCVRASQITASSALISWLPSNSNFQHVVAVNSVEVKVVKPGCFRHHVTGILSYKYYKLIAITYTTRSKCSHIIFYLLIFSNV